MEGASPEDLAASFLNGAPLAHPAITEDLFLGSFPANLRPYRLADPRLSIRAVRMSGEWMICHFCSSECGTITCGGEPWPAGESRLLHDRETIHLGQHRIDRESLDLVGRWMEEMPMVSSIACSTDGDLVIHPTCHPDHLALLRYDQGFSIAPLPGHEVRVNNREIDHTSPIFPSDRLEVGPFRDQAADLIRRIPGSCGQHQSGRLILKNVTKRFPDGAIGLNNVSFKLQSGDFVAIMGPSGSGKSTLLDIIAGAAPSSGTIKSADFKQRTALVPQDDVLFETLTVEENLRHAGRLRSRADEAVLTAKINEVLPLIGLEEKRHLRAGSDLDKTLSGGQRRRLSIGLELMGDPALLILDEPTSGLSGPDAASVVTLLRKLSACGTLVLATIHQPSPDVFACFDKLIVLDRGGVLAYFGYAREASGYFTGTLGPGAEQILGTLMRSVRQPGEVAESRIFEPTHWGALYEENRSRLSPPLVIGGGAVIPVHTTGARSWSEKLRIVTRRESARRFKDWRMLIHAFMLAGLLGGLIAIVCRQGDDYQYTSNKIIASYAFLAVILTQFLAASAAVGELVKDRRKQQREKLLEIGGGTYVVSKLPYLILTNFLQAGVITWTGYQILQIPAGFYPFWMILGVAACTASALGLLLSALPGMSETKAMAAVPLLLIPQIVLAGADPFAFRDLQHLNWPFPKHQTEERSSAAPWFTVPVPSRWAYEGTISTWTDLPELKALEQAKEQRITLNFFKRHRREFQENRVAFEQRFQDQFDRPYNHAEFSGTVGLLARAGILSEKDVVGTYLLDWKTAAPDGTDLKNLQHDVLLSHAGEIVIKDRRLLGFDANARTHANILLTVIASGGLMLAVMLNRKSLGQTLIPRLAKPVPSNPSETKHSPATARTQPPVVIVSSTTGSLIGQSASPAVILIEPTPTAIATLPEQTRGWMEKDIRISGAAWIPSLATFHLPTLLARITARKLHLPLERVNAPAPLEWHVFTEAGWLPALGAQLIQISQCLHRESSEKWSPMPPVLHFHLPKSTDPLPEIPANIASASKTSVALITDERVISAASSNKTASAIFLLKDDPTRLVNEWKTASAGRSAVVAHRRGGDGGSCYFDALAELLEFDWSMDSPYEKLARQIHIEYSRVEAADRRSENQSPAVGASWEDLSEEYREFSRDSATHLLASAQGLGFRISPVGEATGNPALMSQLAGRLDELAAAEHYRWMSSRVLNGWQHGATRSDPEKLHPDILPYTELSESIKEKDRACVRALAVMLQRGVLKATPL